MPPLLRSGFVALVASIACLPVNSVEWAREPRIDPTPCVVAIDGPGRKVDVTEDSRRTCVATAQILEPELPHLSAAAWRTGPPSSRPFRADENVYCRLVPRKDDGGSLKFRCMRTDASNRLYDDEGELATTAATFDADGVLLDRKGDPVLDDEEKTRKADELRVKYFLGAEPEPRHREMFTETVVSHLFWALGIPVDRVYMPASVRCFGCGPNPDQQLHLESGRVPREFRFASIERRYDGKRINVDRRRGWMGLGGDYGHGFAFAELEGLAASRQLSRTDLEVLIAALNVVGYNSPSSYQNELLCRPGQWSKETGVCRQSVAYVQDVGGTLGGEKARSLPGLPRSEMKDHPRGDWPTFSQERVFRDSSRCILFYEIAGVDRLTESGRQAFARRIRGRVGLDELLLIVRKANIHRMDARVMAFAGVQSRLPEGPALDRRVQRMWAVAINNRLREILNARCPA